VEPDCIEAAQSERLETTTEHTPHNRRRVLPFRKISNFRDLGGYPARNGRRVKWGVLYRSGHLNRATKADQRALRDLGVSTLIDFRSDREREREPDQLPAGHQIEVISIPIQHKGQAPLSAEIRTLIKDRALNGLDPSQKMAEMYTLLASEYTTAYREFFNTLLDADGKPILWHCSAGKDRAGFAAALLLKILGVGDDVIIKDYLLSQTYVQRRRRQLLTVSLLRGLEAGRFIRGMNNVELDWLQTAFKTIERDWGCFDLYTSEALGLGPQEQAQLKDIYLS